MNHFTTNPEMFEIKFCLYNGPIKVCRLQFENIRLELNDKFAGIKYE